MKKILPNLNRFKISLITHNVICRGEAFGYINCRFLSEIVAQMLRPAPYKNNLNFCHPQQIKSIRGYQLSVFIRNSIRMYELSLRQGEAFGYINCRFLLEIVARMLRPYSITKTP